jgi:hypothetical protein
VADGFQIIVDPLQSERMSGHIADPADRVVTDRVNFAQ